VRLLNIRMGRKLIDYNAFAQPDQEYRAETDIKGAVHAVNIQMVEFLFVNKEKQRKKRPQNNRVLKPPCTSGIS
jgi:hypothetical protein